jgi:hypothetical protein
MKKTSLVGLLALTACGGGGEEGGTATQPKKVTTIQAESPYVKQLRALSQQNRDLALRRAIQDSGQTCKRIESSQESGTYKNLTSWTARCEGGKEWAIYIAPTGDAQVRSCEHVQQLGLPGCAPKAGQEPSTSSKE